MITSLSGAVSPSLMIAPIAALHPLMTQASLIPLCRVKQAKRRAVRIANDGAMVLRDLQ